MGAEDKPTHVERQALDISPLIDRSYRSTDIAKMETIGRRVKLLREMRGPSQTALARRIEVTQSAISQIESGMTETLRGEVLAGLCRELGAMPDYIMHGKGRVTDHETAVLLGELYRAAQSLTPKALLFLVRTAKDYAEIDGPIELAREVTRPEPRVTTRPGKNLRAATPNRKKKVK